MKIIRNCAGASKPAFDLKAFEASLNPGDVFYRRGEPGEVTSDGRIIFMRVMPITGGARYVNLTRGISFDSLSPAQEYFLAPDATLALNIKG